MYSKYVRCVNYSLKAFVLMLTVSMCPAIQCTVHLGLHTVPALPESTAPEVRTEKVLKERVSSSTNTHPMGELSQEKSV